jgi:hypothetical protein
VDDPAQAAAWFACRVSVSDDEQEKPAQEKPAQEKPAQEKPAQEKPATAGHGGFDCVWL